MILATVIEWLLERIGLVIVVIVFVSQIVRGLWRASRDRQPPEAKPDAIAPVAKATLTMRPVPRPVIACRVEAGASARREARRPPARTPGPSRGGC